IQLPTGSLPMGTAVSQDRRELYVSTGRGNAIVIVDTEKSEVVTTIHVGNRVWGIALDPSGTKLYTANGASNDVSVVDLKSRKELHRIKVGDGPWGIAVVRTRKEEDRRPSQVGDEAIVESSRRKSAGATLELIEGSCFAFERRQIESRPVRGQELINRTRPYFFSKWHVLPFSF